MTNPMQRAIELTILVVVLVAGWFLRVEELELYRMSPDEGSYLYSAGIARLDPDTSFTDSLAEDFDWFVPSYYAHSYLHQLAIRWAWRAGANAVTSVRIDSAILGLLTSLVVYLFTRRMLSGRNWAALLAAGIVSLQCLHVWYSRTGWGATGSAAFYAVYLALGYELLCRERRLARDIGLALAMGMASLLAYGWHEMIVVHVAGMGIFVLLHHVWGGVGFEGRGFRALIPTLRRSRKAWMATISALPIVGLFIALLFSSFARQHWINFEDTPRPSLAMIIEHFFTVTDIHLQFAVPVLVLAALGFWKLRQTDRFAARYLGTAFLTSCLIFLMFFKDANLIRIYLPTAIVLAVLAGNGLVVLADFAGERWRESTALAGALLLMGWMGAVTYRTVLDWEQGDELFFEPRFHHLKGYELVDSRDVHDSTFAILRERLQPGETVGVEATKGDAGGSFGEFSILFKLRDEGFSAAPVAMNRSGAKRPRFLMGVKRGMGLRGHTVETGGPYREIGADRFGRIALYELQSSQ